MYLSSLVFQKEIQNIISTGCNFIHLFQAKICEVFDEVTCIIKTFECTGMLSFDKSISGILKPLYVHIILYCGIFLIYIQFLEIFFSSFSWGL